MTHWQSIHDTCWRGMKNPDLAAFETYFGKVRLLVIHDCGGWSCKCLIFGEVRLKAINVEEAKRLAVAELLEVLTAAVDAMEAAGERQMVGAGR